MTNRDPYNERRMADGELGTGTIIAALLGAFLVLGGLIWVLGSSNTTTASNPAPSATAPSTTGQGGTSVDPGPAQNVPNPTPPAAQQ
jgi:hypothetical protein